MQKEFDVCACSKTDLLENENNDLIIKSNNAGNCPICDKDCSLDYDIVQFDGDMCWFPWRCGECGAEGEEWYKLTFIGHNVYNEEGDCIEITDDMIEEEK